MAYDLNIDFTAVWSGFMSMVTGNIGYILVAMGVILGLWFVVARFNNATGHGRL